jgi:high-affinity nickel-transport protein
MGGFILLLHIAGWGLLLSVTGRHYAVGTTTFGVGTGLTAYTLGMRHAFDADHIAAIDNTTRKLMSGGERPLSVGFWFSLGHSSIVLIMTVLLALGVKSLGAEVTDSNSTLHTTGGLIGTLVSGTFLMAIALINLLILRQILGAFRKLRAGEYDEAELDTHLAKRGLMNRILGRVTRAVSKPWQMYPTGLLFGLGFDTFTEVAFLVLAGTSVAAGLPWYAVLSLPLLFAAGMSLLDTIDGSFMNFAYGWAFANPIRKIYYNLTVTGLSVAVAMLIGGIELLSVVQSELSLSGRFWSWVAGVDLNKIGFGIVALFALTWAVALAVWKYGRLEDRWRPEEG